MRGLTAFAAAAMLTACTTAHADKNPDEAASQPAAQTQPASAESQPAAPNGTAGPGAAEYREVSIPAGTILHVTLDTAVGSDISRIEEPVKGALQSPVVVHGVEVLPAGTSVLGHVTSARRPGRVRGRGYVAMRFTNVDTPGEGTTKISTATVGHLAPATKQNDALKIIAPAAGAAVLGRVVGGKSGARKGAVIGGAAGTGYVLSTRGKEARLDHGAHLAVKLTAPVTVRVRR